MKIIDLLNKLANGEEVPKKIRITILDDRITRKYNFFYDEDYQEYKDDELFTLGARIILERVLNEKVEIIEEEPKTITKESIEALGYACGEIRKLFENGWNKSLENKPLIEDPKKIEKITVREKTLGFPNGEWTARNMDKAFAIKINELIDEINNLKEE